MGKDDRVCATSDNVRMEAGRVNVATSNASDGQYCVSHNNDADPVENDTTHRHHETQLASQLVMSLYTAPNMPLLIDLDSLLGQSEDEKTHF